MHSKLSTGVGEDQIVLPPDSTKTTAARIAQDWSRDGKLLLYTGIVGTAGLWVLPLQGDRKPVPFVTGAFIQKASKTTARCRRRRR